MLLLTPFGPPLPHHTASDRDCRESAALRRRLVEGGWIIDAALRQAGFFAEEVRELLPAPVTSRNAALQIWGQIATLYDDTPTVEATGAPDLSAILTPDLWPMRQQAHLLQVAANECLMRVDIDADQQITYRVVPADTVVLRSAQRRPAGAAPFNPIRGQPVRVEECRLRVSPQLAVSLRHREVAFLHGGIEHAVALQFQPRNQRAVGLPQSRVRPAGGEQGPRAERTVETDMLERQTRAFGLPGLQQCRAGGEPSLVTQCGGLFAFASEIANHFQLAQTVFQTTGTNECYT